MTTHSAINDNIERLEFLFAEYTKLHETRPEAYKPGRIPETIGKINFCVHDYLHSKRERILLELLLVWAVISLESLVNHVIAEAFPNNICSIFIIENPKKMTETSKYGKRFNSELQHKLLIVGDDSDEALQIASSLSRLISLRNTIVHDKPFKLNQLDDDVEVTKLSKWKDESVSICHSDAMELFPAIDAAFDYLKARIGADGISDFRFVCA